MKTKQFYLKCTLVMFWVMLIGTLSLKAVAQQDTAAVAKIKIEVKQIDAQKALVLKAQIPSKEIGTKMGELYGKLFTFIGTNRIGTAGTPFAVYYEFNPEGNTTFEVGIPIKDVVAGNEEIKHKEFPAMKAVGSLFIGAYDKTAPVYEAILKYIKDNNMQINGASWEVYLTDPMMEKDPNRFQTLIYYPVK